MWGMCEWPGKNEIIDEMVKQINQSPVVNWFNQKYFWPMTKGYPDKNAQREFETTEDFAKFKEPLEKLLNTMISNRQNRLDNNSLLIELGIHFQKIVVDWGGITQAKIPNLCFFMNQRIDNLDNLDQLTLDWVNDNILNRKKNIASWSKIFAALKPGKLFIYDSRVAIALSYFCLETNQPSFWNIPDPRPDDDFKRFAQQCKTSRRNQNPEDMDICYSRYHDLLKTLAAPGSDKTRPIRDAYNRLDKRIRDAYEGTDEKKHQAGFTRDQAIMAHIEKMLFMMKEPILDRYRTPWQQPQN